MAESILFSLVPVPFFYIVYFRYYTFKPEFNRHIASFLSGIAYALFMILLIPYFSSIKLSNPLYQSFLMAALPEKVGALIILYFIFKGFGNFRVLEGVVCSIIFALGFSFIENLFYATEFGISVIPMRILFTVPLHLFTCGIMGYFLSVQNMSRHKSIKNRYIFWAFLSAITLHGLFDYLLITGHWKTYLVPLFVMILAMVLEFLMAQSKNYATVKSLKDDKLEFEDWISMYRQPRYERWIRQSMGTPDVRPVSFFLWRPNFFRFFLVIVLLIFALSALGYKEEFMKYLNLSIRPEEEIILLGVYPSLLSFILILVGAINPNFFSKSQIRIPVISDVELTVDNEDTEYIVTFDITSSNCFLKTAEPIKPGTVVELNFELPGLTYGPCKGEVVWENHQLHFDAIGSIVRFTEKPKGFGNFILRYHIFRIKKGLYFLFRLPGFESIRRLFMRPITTMQSDRLCKAGSVIFREHEEGREFYLLKKGKIIIYKKKESGEMIPMDTVEQGEIFGEMSLLADTPRAASAMCLTDCIISVAERNSLLALIHNNVDFALRLVESLANRIHKSEHILVDNIHAIEKQKRDNESMLHTLMLFLLVGLSEHIDEEGEVNSNLKRLRILIENMDDGIAHDLIYLITTKQHYISIQQGKVREDLQSLQDLFNKYDIK